MPGFVVQGKGGFQIATSSRQSYYYSYTWQILNLLGTNFTANSPLVQLQSAMLPTFTVNKERVKGASVEYKFADGVSWDDVEVSWYDTDGLLDHIKRWRASVWSVSTGIKPANEYKKQSIIDTYLPTGKQLKEWKLVNSWPSQIKYGDLTYTETSVRGVRVVITYDWSIEQ